ncbi:hypothetical protein [Colwellia piezophila]|uniref:hypothetical protein n=1 Tax=Colwellia piezophila TaxID=211668 RepID=UPI000380F251|nr:hypothetical protein [Colwellia piezophila]
MRIIQTIGAALAFIAVILLYLCVSPISPNSPDNKIVEAGWLFTYVVTPMFYVSALLVIPSTIALFNSNLRSNYNITGMYCQTLLGLNILISLIYIVLFSTAYLLM